MKIRPTTRQDIADLQIVLSETELFPADMLPDMIDGFLSQPETPDIWLTAEQHGRAVGFCYVVPEQLAEGAWNMLAIAVRPAQQGSGCGAALTAHVEQVLRETGQRILIADTSGTEEFAPTRAFYHQQGYSQEACIRDFWAEGDDKVVFWKSLK